MMVRERGRCVRQLSLEGPVRGPLRRQASEDLRPGPLKIAWAAEPQLQIQQPSNNVEIVAKKCGQPKPAVVKPPRSPFLPDQNTVLFSRQQLTERLRSSWKKKNGRHNLNIFLNQNQSVDSDTDLTDPRPRTPDSSDDELSDKELAVTSRTPEPTLPPQAEREKLCASERRMNFRNAGRQKVVESLCPTPEPRVKPPLQRMMSAPVRAPVKKLVRAPSVDNQRVKCAPSKKKLKPPPRRKPKEENGEEEKTQRKGVRRGVERGEVITMVSLVSPAESDSDEPVCMHLPPTPNPTPPPPSPKEEPKPPPPPPPIICLRKPLKAVTFRPAGLIQTNGTQFQTNYTLKRTPVVNQTNSPPPQRSCPNGAGFVRPPVQRQGTVQPRTPVPQQAQTIAQTAQQSPILQRQPTPPVLQTAPQAAPRAHHPLIHQTTVIRRNSPTIAPPLIQPVVKIEPKQTNKNPEPKSAEVPPDKKEGKGEENVEVQPEKKTVPDFKNQKEKECWDLFKKMSDRGVPVSFETVLRGLLTPTEYRMRKAALLSVC
ncbi:pollen-specific leucine-rich repeat extensin-like protein 2 [Cimex lectularius]|uniref:Uncharacterized protein n=1 Tax=Cimex lectularius TaxID=79782 RepID=A0A8I6SCN2_CIMLE|nr:pollen-specific leucine-rich repeat extensin-like protein 2 [Cimex lectularius]